MTHRTVIAAGDHIAQNAPLAWFPLPWCCLWAVTGVTHTTLCATSSRASLVEAKHEKRPKANMPRESAAKKARAPEERGRGESREPREATFPAGLP